MELFESHLFAPISVLLDAFLRFTYTPTATTNVGKGSLSAAPASPTYRCSLCRARFARFGGGGYLDIVLPDNKLASFIIKAKVEKCMFCGIFRPQGGRNFG